MRLRRRHHPRRRDIACCRVACPRPSASAAASPGSGVRPIVFDTDMGMDDLLALYIILREPTLDVRAIAIDGTGLVHCGPGDREHAPDPGRVRPARHPVRLRPRGARARTARPSRTSGAASSDRCMASTSRPSSASELPPDAVTVLHEALAASAEPVTVLAVGTWTNLQDLFAAHPRDLDRVAGIHTMAGTIDEPGNIELGGDDAGGQGRVERRGGSRRPSSRSWRWTCR